jgi:hypothetical protein
VGLLEDTLQKTSISTYLYDGHLCAYIYINLYVGETLGVKVQPSEVRLKPEEDMLYRWKIKDPYLEPLFQKYLSKHSVGVYMLLQREAG